ncbi:MAG: hypothetical protein DRP56_04085 [Planctomycetota bacterium]|nr:MAG: hypothetical protein DRP56_04085 [Planctomycetota bacterium]
MNESRMRSVSEQARDRRDEIVCMTEPNDVLVLGQTLMHNPELKVFSLEIRAAQARRLQAGLWPNPEIDIEMENIGGTGTRFRSIDCG